MSRYFGKENEKMKEYKEGLGSNAYLNGGDIDEKGLKLRIIPWMCEGEVEELVPFYEGWEEYMTDGKKPEKKARPRRFTLDDTIPDGINWQVKENTFSHKQEASTPKQAIGFLAFVHKDKKIKLAAFTQATIVKAFIGMKDEESEMYCKDLSKVDIIIKRKPEKEGKGFVISFAPNSEPELPEEAMKMLEAGYIFSWSAFMKGEDPFEDGPEGNVWKEVIEAQGGKQTKKDNKNTKTDTKAKTSGDEEELKNWKTVKQSNGSPLGDLSLPKLQQLKALIEEKKKTSMPIYPFVKYAVENFENSNEEEEIVV